MDEKESSNKNEENPNEHGSGGGGQLSHQRSPQQNDVNGVANSHENTTDGANVVEPPSNVQEVEGSSEVYTQTTTTVTSRMNN